VSANPDSVSQKDVLRILKTAASIELQLLTNAAKATGQDSNAQLLVYGT
jgi:hypothetical protein